LAPSIAWIQTPLRVSPGIVMFTNYGAASGMLSSVQEVHQDEVQLSKRQSMAPALGSTRKRPNLLPCFISILMPTVIFVIMMATLSFMAPNNRSACTAVCALCLVPVILAGAVAGLSLWRYFMGTNGLPVFKLGGATSWLPFLFFTSLAAWILGYLGGTQNYATNSFPYYTLVSMTTYLNVDPSAVGGQAMMDLGRAFFEPGVHISQDMSMGFKNMATYCVAPVIMPNRTMSSYDFWAVGTNCCSKKPPRSFTCGAVLDLKANAGVRVVEDGSHAYYRLAVQMAESAYNISAPHPIFVNWDKDPSERIRQLLEKASAAFSLQAAMFLVVQSFLVAFVALAFFKHGSLDDQSLV